MKRLCITSLGPSTSLSLTLPLCSIHSHRPTTHSHLCSTHSYLTITYSHLLNSNSHLWVTVTILVHRVTSLTHNVTSLSHTVTSLVHTITSVAHSLEPFLQPHHPVFSRQPTLQWQRYALLESHEPRQIQGLVLLFYSSFPSEELAIP